MRKIQQNTVPKKPDIALPLRHGSNRRQNKEQDDEKFSHYSNMSRIYRIIRIIQHGEWATALLGGLNQSRPFP